MLYARPKEGKILKCVVARELRTPWVEFVWQEVLPGQILDCYCVCCELLSASKADALQFVNMVCLPLIAERNAHEICLTQECLQCWMFSCVRHISWAFRSAISGKQTMFTNRKASAIDASRKPRHYMRVHLVIVNFFFRGGTTFSYEYQMLAEVECQRSRSWELRNRLSKPLFPKNCRQIIPHLVKRVVEKSCESSQ